MYLENRDQSLRKIVKVASSHILIWKIKLPPENLHAEQSEDDDEEEEEQKQGGDRAHRVQERRHQITERRPVPENHAQF